MSVEVLEKYFGIKPEKSLNDGRAVRYVVNNSLYTIIPVTHMEQDALIELYEMSDHMAKYGDKRVSIFVPGIDQKYLVTHKDQDFCLLHNHNFPPSRNNNIGVKLAKFHERGKALQATITEANRMGEWKSLWVKRLEQMERVWGGLLREQSDEEFDRLFIKSFPYYLGLCENAIQYLTDTELDEAPHISDRGTICNLHFNNELWKSSMEIRNPFDWVFDHPSRDLAEWVRDCYFRNRRSFQPEVSKFLQGYESIAPLSSFSWRLLYARLLFPLHYFTCVEDYYITGSQWTKKQLEERLSRYIRDSKDYEMFLGNFYYIAYVDHKQLPVLDWLRN
ncbi:spore coat putative kinase YutH [Lederbergia citrea]|uniref:Spore coat protein YutH n=1 Tax=Lederbergia citrea TaxID=2833581 RepID=A0A942UU07_9BACI|nr:spore coat protein YutH [Lederbergia citrea]MBS4178557.1 spore coat protein YutH [Lederbergia citrea]MBS4205245.1 spore coat protein YutH [Lederbergia citrea]MBS4222894.1 spore coat protein YutH [Lederbergia citrea]